MKQEEKGVRLNIGLIILILLFIYSLISVFIYIMTPRVSPYMVTFGTLSNNNITYTAIAVRDETLVSAPTSGYVNYYIKSGQKASKNDVVCSIMDSRPVTSAKDMTQEDLSQIRSLASKFTRAYDSAAFDEVYNLKYALSTQTEVKTSDGSVYGSPVSAETDGIVSYVTDGMEKLDPHKVKQEDFSLAGYKSKILRSNSSVKAGDTVYKIIGDDTWQLVFELSDNVYTSLQDKDSVKVLFEQDEAIETGELETFEKEEEKDGKKLSKKYALVTLHSGMVRYCNERMLRIELLTDTEKGLKIPLSAIVTKEFYKIPVDYLTSSGNGFLRMVKDKKSGEDLRETVTTDLYAKVKGDDGREYYCVEIEDFNEGDIIIKEDSNSTFIIGPIVNLEGVYCINRSYAQFRKVEQIEQNTEFMIVKPNTSFGISQYDYIVRDQSSVNESQILRIKQEST